MSELEIKVESVENCETNRESENDVLNTPVKDIELSVRSRKALRRIRVNTLGDLVNLSPYDLLSCRNFAKISLREVLCRLSEYGLGLKGDSEKVNYSSPSILSEERFQKIRELAEQGLTRREITEQIGGVSYSRTAVLIAQAGIKVKRQRGSGRKTKIDSRIDSLIAEGKTLEEMGDVFGLTNERIRQFLVKTNQHDSWKEARKERKHKEKLPEIMEEQRRNLIGGIIGSVLRYKCKNETDFATRKTLEYFISTKFRTSYSFDELTKLFRIYQNASEKGKKLSLNQFGEKTGLWYSNIGKILNRVGLEPMFGSLEISRLSETELKAIKRVGKISMPMTDLAYFMNLQPHNLSQNFPRLKVKRPEVSKWIKQFGFSNPLHLSYRLASQIYEARDAGYFREFSREQMAGFFDTSTEVIDYALSEKRTLAPKIAKALKTIYPHRKSKKPYKLSTDKL